MFVFKDETCGFAFPSLASRDAGGPGVFVTRLRGDYAVTFDPLTGSGSTILYHMAALHRLADRDVDIDVDQRTGDLTAIPGTSIKRSPYTVADGSAPCATVSPLYPATPLLWQVVTQVNVQCLWLKTILWAWNAHEGKLITVAAEGTSRIRRIINWMCTGSEPQAVGQRTVMTDLSCVNGQQAFHAQGRAPSFTP